MCALWKGPSDRRHTEVVKVAGVLVVADGVRQGCLCRKLLCLLVQVEVEQIPQQLVEQRHLRSLGRPSKRPTGHHDVLCRLTTSAHTVLVMPCHPDERTWQSSSWRRVAVRNAFMNGLLRGGRPMYAHLPLSATGQRDAFLSTGGPSHDDAYSRTAP